MAAELLPEMAETCGAAALAALLGVHEQTIGDLVRRGLVTKRGRAQYEVASTVTRYCAHLRAVAAGRAGAEAQSLAANRARLAAEQADGNALRNRRLRGELLEADAVARAWADVLRLVRAAVLAVPSRVRARLPHVGADDGIVLDEELRAALTALADDANPC